MAKYLEQFVDTALEPDLEWKPEDEATPERLTSAIWITEHAKRIVLRLEDASKAERAIDRKLASNLNTSLKQKFALWGENEDEIGELYAEITANGGKPAENRELARLFAQANTVAWVDWVPQQIADCNADAARIATNALAIGDRDVIKAANVLVNRIINERNTYAVLLTQYNDRMTAIDNIRNNQ